MSPKDIIVKFIRLFDVSEINWAQQVKICKKLLEDYTDTQIIYALNYYKNNGKKLYSLGFLLNRMREPMMQLSAEKHLQSDGNGNSKERNWKRIEQNSKTERRTEYPEYLFTESRKDN